MSGKNLVLKYDQKWPSANEISVFFNPRYSIDRLELDEKRFSVSTLAYHSEFVCIYIQYFGCEFCCD